MKFAATVLIVGTILLTGCGKMGLPPAGPPDVEVVEVVQRDVPITRDWVVLHPSKTERLPSVG
jgi:hypothetical protein